jgi:hypothetical protein
MKPFNLKTFSLFFFLISAIQLNAQGEDFIYLHNDLAINTTYFVFGDNVNLRTKPATTSKEITRLRIGFEVKVIAKTDVIFESSGYKTPWYEVSYKGQKGFIPGKFIAHKAIIDNECAFYFSKKISEKYGDQLAIRAVNGNDYSNYKENFMQLRGSVISAKLEGNHNLKNILHILKIQHHGESCGAENGNSYFFLKENYELVHIADLSVSGDIGFFDSETFTFTTSERNGQPIMIFKKEVSEDIDDEGLWTESKIMTRQFEWNGMKLVPDFSKKFYKRKTAN